MHEYQIIKNSWGNWGNGQLVKWQDFLPPVS